MMQLGNGMNEVYKPPSGASAAVNVVFIHGLFGNPWSTWAAKDRRKDPKSSSSTTIVHSVGEQAGPRSTASLETSTPIKLGDIIFWPKDLLPQVIPNARIYSFGYDANVEKFMASTSASLNSVHEHGHSLLNELSNLLDEQKPNHVPLIFVVHSLGGLVLKEALNQSSGSNDKRLQQVVNSTRGAIFLGTPHRGSSVASYGRLAFRFSEVLARQRANIKLLRALEHNSETLDSLTTVFTDTLKKHPDIRIFSFFEEKETRAFILGARIVEPASAKIDGGEWDGIPENHSNMAKFTSLQDVGFKKVSGVIKRWMRNVETNGEVTELSDPLSTIGASDIRTPRRREQAPNDTSQVEGDFTSKTKDVLLHIIKGGDARGGGFQWTDGRASVGGGYASGASVGKEVAKAAGSGKVTEAEAGGGHIGPESGHGGDARGGNVEIDWP